MRLTEKDFENEVKVEISREAFKDKELHCDACNRKMKKVFLGMEIPNTSLTTHLEAYKCEKCGREYLNAYQAKKLDKALAISRVIEEKGIVYVRSGNFDGSNIFVRFPAQMIKGRDIKAEIRPLSSTDFFVHFVKKDK